MRELSVSEIDCVAGGSIVEDPTNPWYQLDGETSGVKQAMKTAGGILATDACVGSGAGAPLALACGEAGSYAGGAAYDTAVNVDYYMNNPAYVGGSNGTPITESGSGETINGNIILGNAAGGNGFTDGGQLGGGSVTGGGLFGSGQ